MPNKPVTLYLDHSAPPPVVNVTKADTDWSFRFTVMYKNAVYAPNVRAVILAGHKPDGNAFAFAGAKNGDLFVVSCNVQMTAVAGDVRATLHLLGYSNVGIPFILRVAPGADGEEPVASASALTAYATVLNQISQLLAHASTIPDDVAGYIADWLQDNISGGAVVDQSLTVSGAAADAKKTGDRLKALEDATIETDATLTIEGAAADAKAVGDQLKNYETEALSASGNLYDPETMFKDASAIASSGVYIGGYAGRALALIPVTPGKYYSLQAKTLAWTNGIGLAFTDANSAMLYSATMAGTLNSGGFCQLGTPVLMKATSAVSENENVVVTSDTTLNGICVKAPTGAAFMAVEIVYQGQDSRDSFMAEEGRTCSAYSAPGGGAESLVKLFGKEVADKFLRSNALLRGSIGVYGGAGGNIFDISTMMIGGAMVSSGSLTPSTTSVYAKIPVTGGKTYSLSKRGGAWVSKGAVLLLDQNGEQIYRVVVQTETANGDYTYPATLQLVAATGRSAGDIQASADGTSRGLTITVSDDTAFIALNHSLNTPYTDALMVNEGSNCLDYAPYGGGASLEGALIESLCGAKFVDRELREELGMGGEGGSTPGGKRYEGVTWTALGDSITVGGGGGGGGYYADKVKTDLGFTLVNAAHSGVPFGAGMTQSNQIPTGCKICTVALGTNNSLETDESIGQIGDTTDRTLHGQIYLLMSKILTEHPNIILGFIAPVPRYDSDAEHNRQESVRKVARAIVEACAYYCIPCLDLQTTIGFHPAVKSIYYTADNLHPSALGAQRMALAIEQWMTSLLG